MAVTSLERRYVAENVVRLLEEHHLAVLSDDDPGRRAFEAHLREYVAGMPETEAQVIRGGDVTTLEGFCGELDRLLGRDRPVSRSIEGVLGALHVEPVSAKRRYVIWRDADTLLEADVSLFGRLVNAILVVAAAHEHLIPDRLVVLRLVLIGGPKLGAYAEDVNGQFVRWLDERADALSPAVIRRVAHPGVLTYRIDG